MFVSQNDLKLIETILKLLEAINMSCEIMAIGIHPDDVEIGIFGTLAKSSSLGKKIIIVDLTAGEMGSNGTVEIRKKESQNAAKLIQVERICLGLPDRNINGNQDQMSLMVDCIRQYKPEWILYPYHKDYHPDHENGSRLVKEAIHSAGLINYKTSISEVHRPKKTAMYYINDVESPNLFVDISEVIGLKKQALEAHASQFTKSDDSKDTYLNNGFIDKVINRDAYFGMVSKVGYAEPLFLIVPPVVDYLGGSLL